MISISVFVVPTTIVEKQTDKCIDDNGVIQKLPILTATLTASPVYSPVHSPVQSHVHSHVHPPVSSLVSSSGKSGKSGTTSSTSSSDGKSGKSGKSNQRELYSEGWEEKPYGNGSTDNSHTHSQNSVYTHSHNSHYPDGKGGKGKGASNQVSWRSEEKFKIIIFVSYLYDAHTPII